jgi:GNAT superfamily N-acetyltransferase
VKLSISDATSSDAAAIAALRAAVARDMAQRFGEGAWSAAPIETDVAWPVNATRVLVARRNEEIVGTVRLVRALPGVIDASAFTPVTTALYVLGLAVAPSVRSQGVGRFLLAAAKDATRSWPAQALWLDAYEHSAGAGPFYLKCGFRAVGRATYREMPLTFYEWLPKP